MEAGPEEGLSAATLLRLRDWLLDREGDSPPPSDKSPKNGRELRRWREDRELAQRRVADILDLSPARVCQIEKRSEDVPPALRLRLEAWDGDQEAEPEVGNPILGVPRKGSTLKRLLFDLETKRHFNNWPTSEEEVAKGLEVTVGTLRQYCSKKKLPKPFRQRLRAYLWSLEQDMREKGWLAD